MSGPYTKYSRQSVASDFVDDEHTHECLPSPSRAAHKQSEVFLDGQFTTVDIKLERLLFNLNKLGMTTIYSCQGFKTLKKAHKAGFADDRGYIMFRGESVFEMLQRGIALYGRVEGEWNDDESDMIDRFFFGEITRDDHLISPANYKSRWCIEFLLREFAQSPGSRRWVLKPRSPINYDTIIRFPREDLEMFAQVIDKLSSSVES